MQNIYYENYKDLMRDTKEDLTKQKSCVHVSKVSVFLKPII
jgi:hypothetical protein